jgi:hypothetical protein
MKKGVFAGVVMMVLLFTLAIGLSEAQAQPDLKVTSLAVQAATAAGVKIFITDVTKNRADAPTGLYDPNNPLDPTGATFTCYFLSSTNGVAGAKLLGCRYVPRLEGHAKNTGSLYVTIPDDGCTGACRIIARADYAPEFNTLKLRKAGYVEESNEKNNQLSTGIEVKLISDRPDLEISSLTAPGTASPGEDISIGDTTINSGAADVTVTTITKFYLSADSNLDNTDVSLGSRLISPLSAGSSNSGVTNVTIPADTAPSAYYIIAVADSGNIVMESDENNNTMSRAITIAAP